MMISPPMRRAFQASYSRYATFFEIRYDFEDANIGYAGPAEITGPSPERQRHLLVDGFYKTVKWESDKDCRRVLDAYEGYLFRLEQREFEEPLEELLNYLKRDGLAYEKGRIFSLAPAAAGDVLGVISATDVSQLRLLINRMNFAVDNDPPLAVGTAKELVEACCKAVLQRAGEEFSSKDNIPQLVAKTTQALNLRPQDMPEEAKGVEAIKKVLGSLAQIVQGMAELRNEYGAGHGREPGRHPISPRHARLAAGAAATLSFFLVETVEAREASKK